MDIRYQVRYGKLNAADYGAPQSRTRAIYMAARADLNLPQLPSPTHFSTATHLKPNTAPWGIFPVVNYPDLFMHGPVSVGNAINDLPAFNW